MAVKKAPVTASFSKDGGPNSTYLFKILSGVYDSDSDSDSDDE